jgi:hypothetical protein
MSRVIEDIVDYFKTQGVDIMSAPYNSVYDLCIDHDWKVYEHLTDREYPLADLVRSVVEAEQYIEALATEVRTLRSDCRAMRKGGTT